MKLSHQDQTLQIGFEEKLDYENSLKADQEIEKYMEEMQGAGSSVEKIMIDATNLPYTSSAGIRLLLKLRKRCSDFHMLHVSEAVYDAISITGLEEIFGMEKDGAEPVAEESAEEAVQDTRNAADVPADFFAVTRQFEKQAALHPKHPAVVSTQGSFTYEKLNEAANRVAHSLIEMGAGHEDIVCIMLPRSVDMYVATIGVLKAGCAYTIVNPLYPDDRIAFIYRDSGSAFIISSRDMVYERLELFVDELQKRPLFYEDMLSYPEKQNPDTVIFPEDLCYVIYTSGSTGKPKGVMITHGNLANFLLDVPDNHEFRGLADRSERTLAMAQMTFDVSIMEEYIPLVCGHTVVYALYDEIANPTKMIELMNTYQVDGGDFTPSYFSGLLKLPVSKEAIARLKVIDFGAEAFPGSLYTRIRAVNPDVYIMNGYGPTEATISCTMKVIESAENITIGIPNANVSVEIIDDDNRELPKGETGELLIGGKGVGRGYINLEEKTKEAFIEYKGERAYKSGDLARINENNEVEYLGRKDHQVKIRGLRIELEEVESVFSQMPGVEICVAASIDGKYLCLYYVSDDSVTEQGMRDFAKAHLAHYMLPDIYMKLDQMPMTQNRKADRKALPKPEIKAAAVRPPETDMQKKLLELLSQVMEEGEFGIDTNLPESGMSSLDVMLFISLIGEEYKIGINVHDFMENPTVMELERFIENAPKIRSFENLDRYHTTDIQLADYMESMAGGNSLDLPMLYELDPSVDNDRLIRAIKTVLDAHPGLTVRFMQDEEGVLWQIPQTDTETVQIPVRQMEDAAFDAERNKLFTPIPSDAKWLFSFEIIETQSRKFLLTNYNHLVSDGESIDIVFEDIIAAYEGREIEKETLPMTEYAEFLHDFPGTKAGKRSVELYMAYLLDAGGVNEMPGDSDKTKDGDGFIARHIEIPMSAGAREVDDFCRKNHFSKSTLYTAAFGIVLANAQKRDSSAFCIGFSGRMDSRLSATVGYVATLLMAFCHPKKYATVAEYLRAYDRQMLNLMTYPVMPLPVIMTKYPEALNLAFIYQPYAPEEYTMDGKTVKAYDLQENLAYEKMPFIVQPYEQKDGSMTAHYDFHGNLYSDALVRDLAQKYDRVVTQMIHADDMSGVLAQM